MGNTHENSQQLPATFATLIDEFIEADSQINEDGSTGKDFIHYGITWTVARCELARAMASNQGSDPLQNAWLQQLHENLTSQQRRAQYAKWLDGLAREMSDVVRKAKPASMADDLRELREAILAPVEVIRDDSGAIVGTQRRVKAAGIAMFDYPHQWLMQGLVQQVNAFVLPLSGNRYATAEFDESGVCGALIHNLNDASISRVSYQRAGR